METTGDKKLTPEIEAQGLKAYEQVCAFERLRSWRLPLGYVVFTSIPILTGMAAWRSGREEMAWLNYLAAALFLAGSLFQWKRLCVRYVKNLRLLGEMEQTYGEQLPWIKVENHFAALEKLKRELAEERSSGGK